MDLGNEGAPIGELDQRAQCPLRRGRERTRRPGDTRTALLGSRQDLPLHMRPPRLRATIALASNAAWSATIATGPAAQEPCSRTGLNGGRTPAWGSLNTSSRFRDQCDGLRSPFWSVTTVDGAVVVVDLNGLVGDEAEPLPGLFIFHGRVLPAPRSVGHRVRRRAEEARRPGCVGCECGGAGGEVVVEPTPGG